MGKLDIFKKKQVSSPQYTTTTRPQSVPKPNNTTSNPTTHSYTSKESYLHAIKSMARLAVMFKNSPSLITSGGGRNQKMERIMYSYAGILGYLYENVNMYGEYKSIVSQDMWSYYVLTLSAMSDDSQRKEIIKQLSYNWSDVLVTVMSIQREGTSESSQFSAFQQEIDFITKVIEAISGSKCKDPNVGFNAIKEREVNKEKYAMMVENATFNPFNITNDPALQNNPPLPDFFYETFKKELVNIFSNPATKSMNPKDVFRGYIFNLVESYYQNAGYVPKTTVDAFINDCYKAVQQTQCCTKLGTLDELYYWVYYGFLNR